MNPLLQIEHVGRTFGGLRALTDVTFDIHPGEILGLIGPNGAGKTTLVNVVTGVYRADSGRIFFDGKRIDHLKAHVTSRLGLSRTFQVMQPFPDMSVLENVAAGALFAAGAPDMETARSDAMRHLEFVGLAEVAEQPAASLPLAGRKRLELAKSLAMKPKLLLLDEVMAGLNAAEITPSLGLIRSLVERDITILLIEHVMKVVMSVCTRVVVLHHGELICQGSPEDVVNDEQVIKAYLGSKFAARRVEGTA